MTAHTPAIASVSIAMPIAAFRKAFVALAAFAGLLTSVQAETNVHLPWKSAGRALVVDAYEYNEIDLTKIAANDRVAGFIHKGSDGLPPVYGCKTAKNLTEKALCKKDWKVYSVARELYQTRRALAKALGLKWGVYHMGRPGNPIDQANHLIDFATPAPDDLIALDIEDNSPDFISLTDAEEFARHINRRLGRYPLLYTNGSTARYIAEHADDLPLLSRLPLWYARYRPEIVGAFPKGNWNQYTFWQFASHVNCKKDACPHRLNGAGADIDINISTLSVDDLRKAWPYGKLEPNRHPKSDKALSELLLASALGLKPHPWTPREWLESLAAKTTTVTAAFTRAPRLNELPPFGLDMTVTSSLAMNVLPVAQENMRRHD